jgi:hypothetical protein
MGDLKSVLERGLRGFQPSDDAFERTIRRRDRKRRNQRITAGVVGIAVFVVAVLIIGTVGLSDRTQGPAGGAETGPTVTGPAVTGPTETGPAEPRPAVDADTGWIDVGEPEYDLPPEGAVPSTPKRGKVVAEFGTAWRFVFVYADGRVISWLGPSRSRQIHERRLTPEGVELVRSGAVQAEDLLDAEYAPDGSVPVGVHPDEVPANGWEDPELKPFVPSRYSVCYGDYGSAEPSTVLPFFPAPARAILQGAATFHRDQAECSVVTTDEAHALLEILGTTSSADYPTDVTIEDSEGFQIGWEIRMMLPHGAGYPCPNCF